MSERATATEGPAKPWLSEADRILEELGSGPGSLDPEEARRRLTVAVELHKLLRRGSAASQPRG